MPNGEWDQVVAEPHAVVREAMAAGVYVFDGGIDESVPPVRVAADGTVTEGTYPQTARIEDGYCILELPTYDEAVDWAARIAAAHLIVARSGARGAQRTAVGRERAP